MSLRKLITASLLAVSSTGAFADAADFTDIMSNSKADLRTAAVCSASMDSHSNLASQFQNNMLLSATSVKQNSVSCKVNGPSYTASNSRNLFSQQPQTVAVAEFARFTN